MGFIVNNNDKGLGDTIERFTEATGIKKAVDTGAKFFGIQDCGCKKRKDKLNELIPFKKNSNEHNKD